MLFTKQSLNEEAFVQLEQARMYMPMAVGDYTDFFCSYTHAKNVRQEQSTSSPNSGC